MSGGLVSGFYADGAVNADGVPVPLTPVPVKLNPLHVYWELLFKERHETWHASGNTGLDGLGIAGRRRFESVRDAVFAFVDAADETCTYRLVRGDGVPLLRVERIGRRFSVCRWDAF